MFGKESIVFYVNCLSNIHRCLSKLDDSDMAFLANQHWGWNYIPGPFEETVFLL